jgi:hypothetical protein
MPNCITSRAANWRPKYYISIFITRTVYFNKYYTKTNGKTCSCSNWIKLSVLLMSFIELEPIERPQLLIELLLRSVKRSRNRRKHKILFN